MENASKALIMAGGMLIAIMVASLFVYLFTSYGKYADDMYDKINRRQITQANNEYTKYEGAKDNTIYDVITVVNKAKDNNESLGLQAGDRGYISVGINGINSNLQNADTTTITNLLQTYAESGTKFGCNVYEDAEGLINKVTFIPIN